MTLRMYTVYIDLHIPHDNLTIEYVVDGANIVTFRQAKWKNGTFAILDLED